MFVYVFWFCSICFFIRNVAFVWHDQLQHTILNAHNVEKEKNDRFVYLAMQKKVIEEVMD